MKLPRTINAIRQEWQSREGSQKGQYRLGYADAGLLITTIDGFVRLAHDVAFNHEESSKFDEAMRSLRIHLRAFNAPDGSEADTGEKHG